jgi:hypothetical protein
MPPQEIELLLAHELAYIRRHDCWINTLQVVIETIYFYHPAVWWLSREVRMTRERCCDNMAAPDVSSRLVFARALLTLEQNRMRPLTSNAEVLLPSVGARRQPARIRGAHLRLERETGFLREQKRLMVSQLSDALARSFSQYRVLRSHARRWRASEREYAARFAGLITDHSPMNLVLQSQTSRSEAQIAYYRALAEYNKSTNYIAYLSGTMLADNHITLAEHPR